MKPPTPEQLDDALDLIEERRKKGFPLVRAFVAWLKGLRGKK